MLGQGNSRSQEDWWKRKWQAMGNGGPINGVKKKEENPFSVKNVCQPKIVQRVKKERGKIRCPNRKNG